MAAVQFNFETQSGPDGGGEVNQEKSSLQKTFGNVMNLVNDGLYRMKNREKSE